MAHILGIGIATLDIVNTVESYPREDDEVRALEQRVARGGNATNTLAVLSQLGHACAWGGVVAEEPDGIRILQDLERYGIDATHCRRSPNGKMPTSYVTLNRRNGSRTIVHYRDLPEFDFDDFVKIDLTSFHWTHFEGRNVAETLRMLQWLHAEWPQLPCSVEIEKPRPGIDALYPYADVLLFSRGYATHCGHEAPEPFLRTMREQTPDARLICGWGAQGAYGLEDDRFIHSPAYPPSALVDTLGAGDTLNAGVIDGLIAERSLDESLEAGCRLAGRKCGQVGFDGLTGGAEITA